MGKISLIIKREYLTRVKKKSFVIMTIVGPLLMASLMIVPVWLSKIQDKVQKVLVVDEAQLFSGKIKDTKNVNFYFTGEDIQTARSTFFKEDYNVILHIPQTILNTHAVNLFYKKQPGIGTQETIRGIIKSRLEEINLIASGINLEDIARSKAEINIITTKLDEKGTQEKSNTEASMALGMFAGVLIYFFIFLYGAQVMRGVIEEKTNRIIEVIISSVRPFQLMMGKIIGIALVGLTQFLLWILLTFSIITVVKAVLVKDKLDVAQLEQTYKSGSEQSTNNIQQRANMSEISSLLDTINIPVMIGAFIFYFLGGYLLYSALFAAVGAAVDSEADTQQFMLPITIPLVLSFVMAQFIINNPEGPVAFWFSIIPLTSPVIMMVRIPFGVPYYELILSMSMLIVGFIATTWLAGRIYRTGILMYGKKVSYKELWKWLFYKA